MVRLKFIAIVLMMANKFITIEKLPMKVKVVTVFKNSKPPLELYFLKN